MTLLRVSPLLLLLCVACEDGGGSSSSVAPSDTVADTVVSADVSTDGDGAGGDTGNDPVADGVGPGDTVTSDTSGGVQDGPPPLAEYSGGQCPTLSDGDMVFTSFGESRSVRVYLPPEPEGAGVLYMWHGMGDSVSNFSAAMQAQSIAQSYGWIVVVPAVMPSDSFLPALWGFPSLLGGVPDADLALFDDLAACLDETWQVDRDRIYTMGFSGGALWSTYLLLHRSEILAGAMILSGGVSPAELDPTATFLYESPLRAVPVFLAHGGQTDIYDAVVLKIEFDTMTESLADELVADGHFTILCRHGSGHYFTQGVAVSGFQFLSAHSWKNTTSFWQENGLPGSFDSTCSIH
jgi:predicted esterase